MQILRNILGRRAVLIVDHAQVLAIVPRIGDSIGKQGGGIQSIKGRARAAVRSQVLAVSSTTLGPSYISPAQEKLR